MGTQLCVLHPTEKGKKRELYQPSAVENGLLLSFKNYIGSIAKDLPYHPQLTPTIN